MSRPPGQNRTGNITLENTAFPADRPVRRRCPACHRRQGLIAVQVGPGSPINLLSRQSSSTSAPWSRSRCVARSVRGRRDEPRAPSRSSRGTCPHPRPENERLHRGYRRAVQPPDGLVPARLNPNSRGAFLSRVRPSRWPAAQRLSPSAANPSNELLASRLHPGNARPGAGTFSLDKG